jgi:hypothetical protein
MSRPEETVLNSESGLGLKQRGDKKYSFNPPAGTLILTDKRLIFAQSDKGLAKRMVAGGLLGDVGLKAMTKVKPEELDKALERPESFQLNLQEIIEAKTEKKLGTPYLSVQSCASDTPRAMFYRAAPVSSGFHLRGFDEWAKAIQDAKTSTPNAPSESAQKSCVGCGEKIPEDAKFCPKCGGKQ